VSLALARPTVAAILERALDGERIGEDDAVALLRSRDLVAVGRVANELRNRKTDPSRVTFIIDRNQQLHERLRDRLRLLCLLTC
jgi:2-iminoacetate synthase ThiH